MRGFVAGPAELHAAWRAIEDSSRQVVASFHNYRRRLSRAHICRHHEAGGADAGGLAAVLAGARSGCWRQLERAMSDRPSAARTEPSRSTPAQLGPSWSENRTNVA